MRQTQAIVAMLLSMVEICMVHATKRSYKGYEMLRITPSNVVELSFMARLYEEGYKYEVDFWSTPTKVRSPIDVLVSDKDRDNLLRELQLRRIDVELMPIDVEQEIQASSSDAVPFHDAIKLSSFNRLRSTPNFQFNHYHSYNEIVRYINHLAATYPHIVTRIDIGSTHQGRPLFVVKVGSSRKDGHDGNEAKKAIWVDGCMHAREWITSATVLYFIDKLVQGYSRESIMRRMVDHLDFYFMPVVNADGYEYTRTQDRLWSKNRRPAVCTHSSWRVSKCCGGVDLNRNFDWKWGVSGSSSDPCHDRYHGPEPFSEPETRAIRNFIRSRRNELRGYISLHSYGKQWLIPYSTDKDMYAKDYRTDLEPVAIKATAAMSSFHDEKPYKIGTGAQLQYKFGGGSVDWVKGAMGVKYTYQLQLPPTDLDLDEKYGFLTPPNKIQAIAENTWPGVNVVAREIILREKQAQRRGSTKLTTPTRRVVPTRTSNTPSPQFVKPSPFKESKPWTVLSLSDGDVELNRQSQFAATSTAASVKPTTTPFDPFAPEQTEGLTVPPEMLAGRTPTPEPFIKFLFTFPPDLSEEETPSTRQRQQQRQSAAARVQQQQQQTRRGPSRLRQINRRLSARSRLSGNNGQIKCVDRRRQCPWWAANGYCARRAYVCQRSCRLC